VKLPEESGGALETRTCSRCGGEIEARLLARCPWCFKDFCHSCRFPRGAADYCSRACAEAMFHGGDSEDDAPDE
jgi:hypothetical protein